ncbi:MAG: hypothetical protein ABI877_20550 [Gemmatimonadaceae bacterium]
MTRKQESLLEQLIKLAGDATLVQQALQELNSEREDPPTVREVVRRILELRERPLAA